MSRTTLLPIKVVLTINEGSDEDKVVTEVIEFIEAALDDLPQHLKDALYMAVVV